MRLVAAIGVFVLLVGLLKGNLLVLAPAISAWAYGMLTFPKKSRRRDNRRGRALYASFTKRRLRTLTLIMWIAALAIVACHIAKTAPAMETSLDKQMAEAEKVFLSGNFRAALERFRAVKPSGDSPLRYAQKHHNIAVCCMNLERWDEAEAAFKEAVRYDPENLEAYYNLGRLAARRQDWDAGARYLEAAAKLRPQHAGVLCLLGKCYLALGRLERAFEVADRAEAFSGEDERLATSVVRLIDL